MTVPTSRADFEKIMNLRMEEARLLIDQKQDWDGAYYLAGYAVEAAFKIRVIIQLMKSDSFPEKKKAEDFYRHDLIVLRRLAKLDIEMDKDAAMESPWKVVSAWSEQSRHEIGKTEQEARAFYDAIENGVLPWIKARW